MLDSLVRVSRRVGRVTDTDTADAYMSKVADGFLAEPNRLVPASRYQSYWPTTAPFERAFTPTYKMTLALDTYTYAVRRARKDWLRVPVRGLALNPNASPAYCIGRSAYLREMRRTNATRTYRS